MNIDVKKKDELNGILINLPASHPISILKDEHDIIKRNLKNLKQLLKKLKTVDSFDKANLYVNTLKELSHFFLETEKHHQREEDGVFPKLAAHGITELPEILKEDHVEFKAKKKNLKEISFNTENKEYREFLRLVAPLIEFLTKNLEEHISKEENIVYPLALQALDKDEWKDVRKKFDIIGYCCFKPADIREET